MATGKRAEPAVSVIGTNIQSAVDGDWLVLRINLKERHGQSKTGKTTIVATSSGNKLIEGTGGVTIGLNAYVKGE